MTDVHCLGAGDDPLAAHVERAALDRYTIAVSGLIAAVKRAKPGEVGRALALARSHAETAELWIQAAERIALAEWSVAKQIDGT